MMAALVCLYILKVVFALYFLLVASSYDLKSRLVPNFVWKWFLPVAVMFGVVECVLFGFVAVSWLFVSVGLTCALAFGGFYFKLFGGADAKCLLCLGLCFPFLPFTLMPVFVSLVFVAGCMFVLVSDFVSTVLGNLVDLVRGCLRFPVGAGLWRKFVLFFGATQVKVSKLDGLAWVPVVSDVSSDSVAGGVVWAKHRGAFIWALTVGFLVVLFCWAVQLLKLVGVL